LDADEGASAWDTRDVLVLAASSRARQDVSDDAIAFIEDHQGPGNVR
jgi:hypothetical protein